MSFSKLVIQLESLKSNHDSFFQPWFFGAFAVLKYLGTQLGESHPVVEDLRIVHDRLDKARFFLRWHVGLSALKALMSGAASSSYQKLRCAMDLIFNVYDFAGFFGMMAPRVAERIGYTPSKCLQITASFWAIGNWMTAFTHLQNIQRLTLGLKSQDKSQDEKSQKTTEGNAQETASSRKDKQRQIRRSYAEIILLLAESLLGLNWALPPQLSFLSDYQLGLIGFVVNFQRMLWGMRAVKVD